MTKREGKMFFSFIDILLNRYNNGDNIWNYAIEAKMEFNNRDAINKIVDSRINIGVKGDETKEFDECYTLREELNKLNYNESFRRKQFNWLRMAYAPKFI